MGCHQSSEYMSESSELVYSTERSPKSIRNSVCKTSYSEQDKLRDARLHSYSGGAKDFHSLEDQKSNESSKYDSTSRDNEEGKVLGLEESDSGVHSRGSIASPKRMFFTGGRSKIRTSRGKDLHNAIKQAYRLKERYSEPTKEFLSEMDKLFMDVQMYLTELSARAANHKEADALVDELVALRNYWGSKLLPPSVCNAFVRERIQLSVSNVHYRIDCAQFFEPVPFYSSPTPPSSNELMKLFRFSVYEMSRNEVVMRYYLERSNVVQLYHVLCFSRGSYRGQVHPFGVEPPSYWELREQMVNDAMKQLKEF